MNGPEKLSSADRSGDQQSRGLAAPQLPEDSISETLVSGTLVFISVVIAVLIHDIRHDNELTRELFGTEAELEQTQFPFVSLQSYPSVLDHPFPALSPEETSSPPQIAAPSPKSAAAFNREIIGIAPGLPGANLLAGERQFLRSQQIGLRKSAAARRFNAEWGARVRAINARVAFVDRRTGSMAPGTKGQLRALRKYLGRPRDYLEDLRRRKAVALRRRRHEERSPSWLFRTIGNALNFGIESARLGKSQ